MTYPLDEALARVDGHFPDAVGADDGVSQIKHHERVR